MGEHHVFAQQAAPQSSGSLNLISFFLVFIGTTVRKLAFNTFWHHCSRWLCLLHKHKGLEFLMVSARLSIQRPSG